jgi:hypothetical protein
MSVTVSVFFNAARAPTPVEWQDVIRAAGFDVQLDTDFDFQTFSGFLPATYRGAPAGFELSFERIAADGSLGSKERTAAAAGADSCAMLVTHSNLREMVSAALAAAVLAALTGGVLFDDESNEAHSSSEAAVWARAVEKETTPHL